MRWPEVPTGNRKCSTQRPKKAPPKDQETCTCCGTKGHRRNPPTRIRRKECPAFGTKYNYCDKDHHFERMCRDNMGRSQPRTLNTRAQYSTHSARSHQQTTPKSHRGPPRLRQGHKKVVEEVLQIPTICQATDEYPMGRLRPLWVPPQNTTGAVLC